MSPDFCSYTITTTVDGLDTTVEYDPAIEELVVSKITDTLTPSNPNGGESTSHNYPVETKITVTA